MGQAKPKQQLVDRRANNKQDRMDKLRNVYQRVQAGDADPGAALRDCQEAVLVLIEEFTNMVFNSK